MALGSIQVELRARSFAYAMTTPARYAPGNSMFAGALNTTACTTIAPTIDETSRKAPTVVARGMRKRRPPSVSTTPVK
jgi:hypothetical protein